MSSTKKTGKIVEYILSTNSGFGYKIIEKTTDYDQGKIFRKVVFHTSDRDQSKLVKSMLDKNESIETLVPIQDWKQRILIFKEKHGDRYFLVSTEEEMKLICKKIFEERDAQGWYSWQVNQKEPVKPDFEEASIENLPKSMKDDATKKWKDYKRELSNFKELQENLELYKRAKEGDATACYYFLDEQRDGEYEGYSFEDPEDFK